MSSCIYRIRASLVQRLQCTVIPADAWINEELCRFVLNEDVNGLVYKTLTAIHTLIPAAFLQRGGGSGATA